MACRRRERELLYWIYGVLGTFVFFLLLPLIAFASLLQSKYRHGLGARLGEIPPLPSIFRKQKVTLWLHAASVGEVQAVRVLINELSSRMNDISFVVTTMTEQGLRVAQRQLPDFVFSFMAPLDVPLIVRRVLGKIRPDMYICMETELWPAMLHETRRAGIAMVLVNGRMSERSLNRYRLVRGFMGGLLDGFSGFAVIRNKDAERFTELGAAASRIQVTGNIKYDLAIHDPKAERQKYRTLLNLTDETVFLCGSTAAGEEKILAEVFEKLRQQSDTNMIWVVAPRHLERLPEIQQLLTGLGLGYDLYTELEKKGRRHHVVLVDCMGELAWLYSAGDYNFCGGSLVDRGGHNIMEAARWGRPVYYGPNMKDFADAVELLEPAGAGFQARDGGHLITLILNHMQDRDGYEHACKAAARITSTQRGAAARQADMVLDLLAS